MSIRRHIQTVLSIALILAFAFTFAPALAGGGPWTCPDCGQTGNTGNFCPNCGAAAPDEIDSTLEQIPGETDWVKVLLDTVSANSYIEYSKDPEMWLPVKAADNDERTCWQFSTKSAPLGSAYIELTPLAAQTVDGLWVKNGFWSYSSNGGDLYTKNCRPKKLEVLFKYSDGSGWGDAEVLTLKDDKKRQGWQQFSFMRRYGVTGVRVRVVSAYKGSKYPNDVCLSEIMLVQNSDSSNALPYGYGVLPVNGFDTVHTGGGGGSSGGGSGSGKTAKASLLMRLSTRSGPGTQYDEPGTFFNKGWQNATVEVRGKYWDGNIWWVLVDFSANSARYRVWTGLKRVDVNLDKIPEIYPKGQGTVDATETRRGPGGNYAKGITLKHWVDVEAFGRENGYVEVEYYNADKDRYYRFWVPEKKAHIDWQ